MSENRQLAGPTRRSLKHGERIDWHQHELNQLCYPLRGALQVSTPTGTWLVPPHRAVWVPAGVPHAHRASGPTEMRTLVFAEPVNPLRLDRPTVLTVDALLREVIAALSEGRDEDGLPAPAARPTLGRRQRRNLERVALDRLCGSRRTAAGPAAAVRRPAAHRGAAYCWKTRLTRAPRPSSAPARAPASAR